MNIRLLSYIFACGIFSSCNIDSRIEIGETNTEYVFEDSNKINNNRAIVGSKKVIYSSSSEITKEFQSSELVQLSQSSELVKLVPTTDCVETENYLTYSIVEGIKNGNIDIYDIDDPERQLSFDDINSKYIRIDTIITFDRETYDEIVHTRKREIYDFIGSFKIKQKWYFDKSNSIIESKVTDIIPLAWLLGDGRRIIKKELGVIKNPEKGRTPADIINNAKISWVRKTRCDFEMDAILAKNIESIEALNILFFDLPAEEKIQTYFPPKETKCLVEMDTANYHKIINNIIDTLITFNPETYEEYIQVIRHGIFEIEGLDGMAIDQMWYYNHTDKSLNSQVIGVAPFVVCSRKTDGTALEGAKPNYMIKDELFQIRF